MGKTRRLVWGAAAALAVTAGATDTARAWSIPPAAGVRTATAEYTIFEGMPARMRLECAEQARGPVLILDVRKPEGIVSIELNTGRAARWLLRAADGATTIRIERPGTKGSMRISGRGFAAALNRVGAQCWKAVGDQGSAPHAWLADYRKQLLDPEAPLHERLGAANMLAEHHPEGAREAAEIIARNNERADTELTALGEHLERLIAEQREREREERERKHRWDRPAEPDQAQKSTAAKGEAKARPAGHEATQ